MRQPSSQASKQAASLAFKRRAPFFVRACVPLLLLLAACCLLLFLFLAVRFCYCCCCFSSPFDGAIVVPILILLVKSRQQRQQTLSLPAKVIMSKATNSAHCSTCFSWRRFGATLQSSSCCRCLFACLLASLTFSMAVLLIALVKGETAPADQPLDLRLASKQQVI